MDNTLNELREEIDKIDNAIVDLFEKRQETALKIGRYKRENNIPVTISSREADVINRLKGRADEKYGEDIEDLYKTIFDLSKRLQHKENGSV